MSTDRHANIDEVLRRYLLGTLSAESRNEVEGRLFSDDGVFWERVNLAEDQLVDDYASDSLSAEDREAFERVFLATNERRAKLEFARALTSHVEQRNAAPDRVRLWLRGPLAAPRWAVAAAAVLLLVVLPSLAWHLAVTSAPRSMTVSVWLSPGQVRDIGQQLPRVVIGPDCQMVRLSLPIGPEKQSSYWATLFEVTGDEIEVWSQRRLMAGMVDGTPAVTLTLPCASLPEGDYYVRLRGEPPGAAPVGLGKYSFRVLRR